MTFCQGSPIWPSLFWSGFWCVFFWQTELVQPRPSAEHCIWAQTECSAVCDLWSIFFPKCFEHSRSWCLGPMTSLWLHPIDPLPLATHFFGFIFQGKSMKRKLTSLSAFHSNQLQYTRSACFTFDSSSRYWAIWVSCLVVTSRRSHDRNPGFSTADNAAGWSIMFVFCQISTFTYLRKMFMYQTNGVDVKLYLAQCKWYLQL